MSLLALFVIILLAAAQILAAYISRVYAEFGKILPREEQDDLDSWEMLVEPRLGMDREHAALCASVLQQLSLGFLSMVFGVLLFEHSGRPVWPSWSETAQSILGLLLTVLFCSQLTPLLLFQRTHGRWVPRLLWLVRVLLWAMTPITFFIRFFCSVAALTNQQQNEEVDEAPDVESLLEAGQEEGILEESDRELVRSAVEFGDKLVREVMTPRPEIFAIKASTTIEHFLIELRDHSFSRVPVYSGILDEVTGIAFAHDLLQIPDREARTRTVGSIQREAAFVPETKGCYELLREMQREKQHMRIVVDEYGGVAGLVTIEDLLEEIVGEIHDEHEEEEAALEEPQRQPDGSWILPGGFPVGQLSDLFGQAIELDEQIEAATVSGLISEIEGRIPLTGEIVVLEKQGLRFEVLASTDRLVERLKLFPPQPEVLGQRD